MRMYKLRGQAAFDRSNAEPPEDASRLEFAERALDMLEKAISAYCRSHDPKQGDSLYQDALIELQAGAREVQP